MSKETNNMLVFFTLYQLVSSADKFISIRKAFDLVTSLISGVNPPTYDEAIMGLSKTNYGRRYFKTSAAPLGVCISTVIREEAMYVKKINSGLNLAMSVTLVTASSHLSLTSQC